MKYGTLINGEPVIAPNPLHINGRMVYNPSGNIYVNAGYTPIIDTAMPETGGEEKYYISHWEERDGQIARVWTETEPPAPESQELIPAELREQAYNTLPCVEWYGELLTVTAAAQQWAYYAAEGNTTKTDALTARIAAAKADIRVQWPDADEP
ncbi:MAG: hypothetical protein PUB32_03060 [Clostridiales bacterium]|nr:hypothetical protein [Clostridiales bacterium]